MSPVHFLFLLSRQSVTEEFERKNIGNIEDRRVRPVLGVRTYTVFN